MIKWKTIQSTKLEKIEKKYLPNTHVEILYSYEFTCKERDNAMRPMYLQLIPSQLLIFGRTILMHYYIYNVSRKFHVMDGLEKKNLLAVNFEIWF